MMSEYSGTGRPGTPVPDTCFDPLVAKWFESHYGKATDIQCQAWPVIAQGKHVLMTAPTGSGKTLAAFLWALNQLICQQWAAGMTRVVYVSPLKALNNDIQRNLLSPLGDLRNYFGDCGRRFPTIQVSTRSGDTPANERRRMLRQPPEILITTPESLNILLSSAGGRSILGGIKTVILDEIHSIINSRRGTFLMTAVERLVLLSGEFQRLGLSATVRPTSIAAEYMGGYILSDLPSAPRYTPRQVVVLASTATKSYQLSVSMPKAKTPGAEPKNFWKPYAEWLATRIRTNQSSLVFTNSRQLCEKLTYLINRSSTGDQEDLLAYSHHGSLSKTIRSEVEDQLKAGNLKAIVATSSLELGIDIGALDEVMLVQSPPSVSAAIQRIGRAGHRIGEASRGLFVPTHGMDIVNSAVLVKAVSEEAIENMRPLRAPLDVLAQVLLSMLGFETWSPTELFHQVRTATAYRELSRRQFDLVLDMLEGRYADGRLRALKPRIYHDRRSGTLKAKRGSVLTLYSSGGVIPDRGYYGIRHSEYGAKLGELDEEFVWEARIGQVFTLGTQNWRVQKITSSDVIVAPAPGAKSSPPFWLAERQNRSFHLSEKIGQFLEMAETQLSQSGFDDLLSAEYCLDAYTISQLLQFLSGQRKHTGCALPHRHHLVVEDTVMGAGGFSGRQVVLHTLWGGGVNRPYAMAMEAAWQKRYDTSLQIFATNDGIALLLPNDIPAEDILGLVRPHTLDELLQEQLAQTGFFGARFRECAARALLLPRRSLKHRMPLWLSRLKAQKLMAAVENKSDFPILVEAWRTCLQDEFELSVLKQLLTELESGEIAWTHVRTSFPSPMARGGTWQQVNHHMYQSDQPASVHSGALHPDLIEAVALEPGLRPQIDSHLVDQFEAKCQRLANGYAPKTPEDLLGWVKERLLIPRSEWDALVEAIRVQYGLSPNQVVSPIEDKLVWVCLPAKEAPQERTAGHYREALTGHMVVRESMERVIGGLLAEQDPGVVVCPLLIESDGTGCGVMSHEMTTAFAVTNEELPDRYGPDPSLSYRAGILSEWLRFYGPKTMNDICSRLGMEVGRLAPVMEELRQAQLVVEGRLTTDAIDSEICDRENFETLLRLSRASRAPEFQTVDIHQLPLFLAHHQGVTQAGHGNRSLMDALLPLLGWSASAELWESDLLPVRLTGYQEDWLDQAIKSGELCWLGKEGGKVLFSLGHELDLMQPESAVRSPESELQSDESAVLDLDRLFTDPYGRYPFQVLQRNSDMNAARLTRGLWQAVWRGEVTNDSFTALRHGIVHRFDMPEVASLSSRRSQRRRGRMPGRLANRQWQASLPQGNWYRIEASDAPSNELEREERNKERARMLLDRYGVVFRELLARELPHLQWGSMFRSLRLMELAGEVVGGHFFSHIPGLQFIAPPALEQLQLGLPPDCIFWINATDPASVCSLGLPDLLKQLPKRLPGNHLVYHGSQLVVISRNYGNRLHIDVPADHPKIRSYYTFLHHLLYRKITPLRHILIERINDLPASEQSAYIDPLNDAFEVVADPKGVVLYRRHE